MALGEGRYHTVRLDDLDLRELAQSSPRLFFKQYPPPVIIDEAQYAPHLFPEIKLLIDGWREERIKRKRPSFAASILMTGSEQTEIKEKIQESLGGRLSEYTLHPLSIHEMIAHDSDFNLREFFLKGGWPELYVNPTLRPDQFLNQLIDTFIGKDIARKQGVEKIISFMKALKLLAARTGQLLNVSEIAAQAGVKSPVTQDWINLLEENYVVTQLPSFSTNLSKRVVKANKIFINDVGLASRLQGWRELEPLLFGPQLGGLFETLVFSEILKTKDHFHRRWNLYYWRTKQKEEIDFLIEDEQGKVIALDAKVAGEPVTPKEYLTHGPSKHVYVVSMKGKPMKKSATCTEIPLETLAKFLLSELR